MHGKGVKKFHIGVAYSDMEQMTNAAGVMVTDKTVLIMDEIDGMSAGDRGGIVALKGLIKKTNVCVCSTTELCAYPSTGTYYLHCERCSIPETQASTRVCCQHSLHKVSVFSAVSGSMLTPRKATSSTNQITNSNYMLQVSCLSYGAIIANPP